MRPLDENSGPWVGWSIQHGRRIHERLRLRIGGGQIAGQGDDADGEFEIEGDYDGSGEVALVRRYTYCTAGDEGVGIPYLYRGRWDGMMVSGDWRSVAGPYDGGAFEMWPEQALEELGIDFEREALTAGR